MFEIKFVKLLDILPPLQIFVTVFDKYIKLISSADISDVGFFLHANIGIGPQNLVSLGP